MKRKPIRFYPEKDPNHRAVLKWLETQSGTDNDNLLHLMSLGLKAIEGKTESSPEINSPQPGFDPQDLLPRIREVVEVAVKGALRDGNFQKPVELEEAPGNDPETQAFLKDMAGNF